MTVVTQRCASLKERMEQLHRREELQLQAEQLEQRRLELEEVRTRLAIGIARAVVLITKRHLSTFPRIEASGPRATLARVREKLKEDPGRISSGRDYKTLLNGIDRACGAIESSVIATWGAFRVATDPVDDRLLDRCAQVPGQETAVARVRKLRAALVVLGADPPATFQEYDAYLAAASALVQAWNELDHGNLPESVLRFFKAAQAPAGAGEVLWTPEVRAWLAEHRMLDSVRILFRRVC